MTRISTRRFLTVALTVIAVWTLPSAASAGPLLRLELNHAQTNAIPGGSPGEVIASTHTNGSSEADEEQRLTIGATTGSFHLHFGADTTPELPSNASAAQVQAALRALPSIGSPNVDVAPIEEPGIVLQQQFFVSFTKALANTDVPELSGSDGSSPLRIGPELWLEVENLGDAPTVGPLTFTVSLPSGVRRAVVNEVSSGFFPKVDWSCPGSPGDSTVTCTTSNSIPRHSSAFDLAVALNVDSGLIPGTVKFLNARVSGGGAPSAPPAAGCSPATAAACASELLPIEESEASFGIIADSFVPDFLTSDGVTPVHTAAAHPDRFVIPIDFTSVPAPDGVGAGHLRKRPVESIRNLSVDLPPGFLGDPTAIPTCDPSGLGINTCPNASTVGVAHVRTTPLTGETARDHFRPVWNMEHPKGWIADLAFTVGGNPVHIRARLDPTRNYAITSVVPNINETIPAFYAEVTLWGVPAEASHDSERCGGVINAIGGGIDTSLDCPAGIPERAFLTTPFQCDVPMSMTVRDYDSWQHSGVFGPDISRELGFFSDCDQIPFDPSVAISPTNSTADSPTGLDVRIDVPQEDDPDQAATSPIRDAEVVLPEGLTVNPASANGLAACTPAEISLGTDEPVGCPAASRIADVTVTTPLLPDPIEGTVFLAAPHENPFGSLLAAYIVLSEPERGILVKLPGRIEADPATGRLTGSFEENPQLPFSELELRFKGGAHGTLSTPPTCGDYSSSAEFSPWSGNPAVSDTDSFTVSQAVGGGACPGSEADLPVASSFDAGTVSPVSKSFSPFVLHLRRDDGTQRFGAFKVGLPQGLVGKLAGTSLCSEDAIAAAGSRQGREEQASPSCPAGSHVGEVVAAAGTGPSPYNARGDAYLAGPYKGAPVSLVVITPAVAGPFDLGTIVIRSPLFIDSKTAQITALSDPIPEMLQGIPTDVRSIDVSLDRPEFTLTGTSCDPMSVDGLLTSSLGQTGPLSVRYQLSDCARLGFKPKMTLALRGSTRRTGNPSLTVVLTPRSGDANIASVSVALPPSEFLDNSHIGTVCTRVQFAADQCPAGSIYGQATVTTPLLGDPLAGNVYLRSSDNPLPDLVPDLRGTAALPIKLEAAGRTDTVHGGLRNSFDFVPDAPFSKFVLSLPGGAKGLIENSRNICAKTYRATVRYTAHNNRTYVDHPKLRVGCKKHKPKKGHGRPRSRALG